MAILRVTQKFAKDIKVGPLIEPPLVSKLLDDWAIDRIIISRKKIAMVTHVKSLLTFFISYSEVGGAKNIPECIGVLLSQWLYDQDLWDLGEQAANLFQNKAMTYCKTADRKLLGHMNDFKRCFEVGVAYNYEHFADTDLEKEAESINTMPVTTTKNKYSTPTKLMLKLLGVGVGI